MAKLNEFIQKAIIGFRGDVRDFCTEVKSDCDKCNYKWLCWTALDLDDLKLQFFF